MSAYTSSLGLELITPGSQAGLWGNTCNNTFTLVDQAITGVTPLSFASASGSTYTLTDFNGAQDESRSAVLNITGTASGGNTVVIPNKQKTYLVRNFTGQDVTFRTATPSATYTVGAGYSILIFCDGNNNVFTGIAAPSVGTLLVNAGGTGNTTFTAGFIKSSGGTSALTSASSISLSSEVSGVLPVTNGGTGQSSLTGGALLFGNGTSGIGSFVGSASGQVATWNGSAWTASAPTTGVTAVTASSPLSATLGTTPNISLNTSGVVPGVYTNTNLTVDTYGRITAASSGSSGGTGTVTSVSGSGGATGLTLSGGPITTSGTLTIGGTLAVASGGTGATSASGAATSLGFVPKTGGAFTGDVTGTLFRATTVGAGTSAAVSANISLGGTGSSLNYYAPLVGNQWTSLYFSALTTALADQNYVLTFNSGLGSQYSGYTFNGGGNATAVHGSWVDTSDVRIKENITPVTDGLNKIAQLNPVMYSYKKDSLDAPNKYGLIAQELEQIIPEVVFTNNDLIDGVDDLRSVAYTNIVPILIKAVQELKAEIDTLKAAK